MKTMRPNRAPKRHGWIFDHPLRRDWLCWFLVFMPGIVARDPSNHMTLNAAFVGGAFWTVVLSLVRRGWRTWRAKRAAGVTP
jgi:hypothetical protein